MPCIGGGGVKVPGGGGGGAQVCFVNTCSLLANINLLCYMIAVGVIPMLSTYAPTPLYSHTSLKVGLKVMIRTFLRLGSGYMLVYSFSLGDGPKM